MSAFTTQREQTSAIRPLEDAELELTAEELELVTGGLSIITRLLLIWEGIRMKPVYSSYDPSLDDGGE